MDTKLENIEIESFIGSASSSCLKLTNKEKENLEGEITLEELTKYVEKCKNNVAPGSSGFSNEFY